ncbi:M23 family metallopeptidase [Rickettsiales bacterium]|nr:M23 family metallopeptidase [Rickettsiales bacterium]
MIKIYSLLSIILRYLIFLSKNAYKFLFAPKKLVLISDNSIKNYQIGSSLQIAIFITGILILFLFAKSWNNNNIIALKNDKIINLKKANNNFKTEINSLNSYLVKIDSYFNLISDYDHVKNKKSVPKISSLSIDKFKNAFNTIKLDEESRQIVDQFVEAKILQDNISKSVQNRIIDIEKTLLLTGIDFPDGHLEKDENDIDNSDIVLIGKDSDDLIAQGGPVEDNIIEQYPNSKNILTSVNNKVGYLNDLETILNYLPISKPMQNYYISSNFGHRIDPINNHKMMHRGTDFVGSSLNEKIISPSAGKVIFAGKFYDYGNMVTIDHGFDIKTRYAHLDKIKVKKGDIVDKGHIIGTQGNTGRSTGHHLHYEIRYKDRAIDPKKFLKVGQKIF